MADMLARALIYIDQRRDETHTEDDDLRVLEAIAADLGDLPQQVRGDLLEALDRSGATALFDELGIKRP